MPHLVLAGDLDWEAARYRFEPWVHRWGRAVLKADGMWVRHDGRGLLVEGVVVELSRPLHPVAVAAPHHDDTIVRLWPLAPVERTPAVQRWLALLAAELARCGAGGVVTTNLPGNLLDDLEL